MCSSMELPCNNCNIYLYVRYVKVCVCARVCVYVKVGGSSEVLRQDRWELQWPG